MHVNEAVWLSVTDAKTTPLGRQTGRSTLPRLLPTSPGIDSPIMPVLCTSSPFYVIYLNSSRNIRWYVGGTSQIEYTNTLAVSGSSLRFLCLSGFQFLMNGIISNILTLSSSYISCTRPDIQGSRVQIRLRYMDFFRTKTLSTSPPGGTWSRGYQVPRFSRR